MRTILCGMLVVLFVAGPALAQEKLSGKQQAKMHNQMAKKLFNLGLFQEAAEEYQKAYQAAPAPAFLFNLAQCYKRISRKESIEKAIFYFRSFLNNVPDTPMRDDIEKELAKLEKELAALNKPPPFYKRWWFWTAVGVVAVGATVGTVIALQPDDMEPVNGTAGNFGIP